LQISCTLPTNTAFFQCPAELYFKKAQKQDRQLSDWTTLTMTAEELTQLWFVNQLLQDGNWAVIPFLTVFPHELHSYLPVTVISILLVFSLTNLDLLNSFFVSSRTTSRFLKQP